MLITIVRIQTKEKHPDADSLYIYTVSNFQSVIDVQVVANLDNIYEVGDYAIFATIGSELKDGLIIKRCKIRGANSFGMLLGPSTLPVASDVTSDYCKIVKQEKVFDRVKLPFQKWTSIERLENNARKIRKSISKGFTSPFYQMEYRSKVKLHGTNAAIQVSPDGKVVAQKRTSIIYPDQDNAGFATWVHQHKDSFASLAEEELIVIHGEWCGPKIQKGVACSAVKEKFFAVFMIQYGRSDIGEASYLYKPSLIKEILTNTPCHVLPWAHSIYLDFNSHSKLLVASQEIEKKVLEVEECDPWMKETFDIEGIGEGLVYYPYFTEEDIVKDPYLDFLFKAKGNKHQGKTTKTLVPVDIEKLSSIEEFVKTFVTPNRLEQGLCEACNGDADITYMGTFLSWMSLDIQKESKDELEVSNLTWKDVRKPLMIEARKWFQEQL